MQFNKTFAEYLQKNDLKSTPERFTILSEILKVHEHFDPESLLFRLRTLNKRISRATVYRTLDLLVDCGIVKKVHFGESGWRYEALPDKKSHAHLICINCGKIIEFHNMQIEQVHKQLKREHDVQIIDYSYQVYCKCADCVNR